MDAGIPDQRRGEAGPRDPRRSLRRRVPEQPYACQQVLETRCLGAMHASVDLPWLAPGFRHRRTRADKTCPGRLDTRGSSGSTKKALVSDLHLVEVAGIEPTQAELRIRGQVPFMPSGQGKHGIRLSPAMTAILCHIGVLVSFSCQARALRVAGELDHFVVAQFVLISSLVVGHS
jgi:hypothetical protein